MKLHYTKILLFFFPLHILLTSYHVHNKNKPYITTHHTPTITLRVLSECDTESSIYDNDPQMKEVMHNFDRQTSQHFEQYQERVKDKRQKRKEESDKNIQEIIKKDKMDKSLSEKIEKGCLRCGCALGGGVLPVWGMVGGLWYGTLSQYLTAKAFAAGIEKGISASIEGVKTEFFLETLGDQPLAAVITSETYKKPMFLVEEIMEEYNRMCANNTLSRNAFFNTLKENCRNNPSKILPSITPRASKVAAEAGQAAKDAEAAAITANNAASTQLYNAIGYSVLAILIIVLVMIIIYLILRYRRKKKMKKKAQYTKLLDQ
ncbi:rifin [Plasmodium reichenowi]|uniref:Rifin n=1 Tax=Plasmodium reichenowi TaxID=5854 RepID=A0A060RQ52_PLARE|nr:rifin [Plasmodium reichenowi]